VPCQDAPAPGGAETDGVGEAESRGAVYGSSGRRRRRHIAPRFVLYACPCGRARIGDLTGLLGASRALVTWALKSSRRLTNEQTIRLCFLTV